MDSFALKGDITYTPEPGKFRSHEDSYLVCGDGKVKGKWRELPERFSGIRVEDYSGKLIFPGLCDLHIHSPQYSFRGDRDGYGAASLAGNLYISGRIKIR